MCEDLSYVKTSYPNNQPFNYGVELDYPEVSAVAQVCSGSGWDLVTLFCPQFSFLLLRCELDFAGNADLTHRETLSFLIYLFRAKSKTRATVDLVANVNDHVAC